MIKEVNKIVTLCHRNIDPGKWMMMRRSVKITAVRIKLTTAEGRLFCC